MKSIIVLFLLIILLSGCWTTPEPPNEVAYRGFFVGVGIYENGWTLPSPEGNTEKLEDLFNQCKFGENLIEFEIIERLTNYNATKENILNGILETFADADDNDVSYFYYMGHGGVRDGMPIITPADYHNSLLSAITVHELEATLSMISGTKVVFLETCHAGNFIGKGNNFNDMVIDVFSQKSKDLINKESYQVLASSKGSEYTWDTIDGSYFCTYLIKGCEDLQADTNENEVVDLSELYKYIKFHVTRQTVQIYPEESTFPIVEGMDN